MTTTAPPERTHFHRGPVEVLRSKMELWSGRKLKYEEVVYILKSAARIILPAANLGKRCPTLEAFAHWCLHHQLDRTHIGAEALIALAEAIPVHDSGDPSYGSDWLTEVANSELSFHTLRLDLLAFCEKFDMPDHLFRSWDGWQRFCLPLAEEISGRPVFISPDDRRLADLRARQSAATFVGGRTLTSVRLVCASMLSPKFAYSWAVQVSSGETLILTVLFGERELKEGPKPAGWKSPLS